MKLKVRLEAVDTAILFQVLEQEGKFRGTENVRIAAIPEINRRSLFLRGSAEYKDLQPTLLTSPDKPLNYYIGLLQKFMEAQTYKSEPKEFKRGDLVNATYCIGRVSGAGESVAYLAHIEGCNSPHICVDKAFMENYLAGETFSALNWKHVEPVQQGLDFTNEGNIYTWEIK